MNKILLFIRVLLSFVVIFTNAAQSMESPDEEGPERDSKLLACLYGFAKNGPISHESAETIIKALYTMPMDAMKVPAEILHHGNERIFKEVLWGMIGSKEYNMVCEERIKFSPFGVTNASTKLDINLWNRGNCCPNFDPKTLHAHARENSDIITFKCKDGLFVAAPNILAVVFAKQPGDFPDCLSVYNVKLNISINMLLFDRLEYCLCVEKIGFDVNYSNICLSSNGVHENYAINQIPLMILQNQVSLDDLLYYAHPATETLEWRVTSMEH